MNDSLTDSPTWIQEMLAHLKMMVDFSLSAVIFATPNFHYRKFFLRHAVDFGESFEAGVIVLSELRVT